MVTETYAPEINGVANTLTQFAQGLKKRGHHIQLVRPRQGPHDQAADDPAQSSLLVNGFPVPGYQQLHFGMPSTKRLKTLWQAQRPDVVYIATEGLLGRAAIHLAGRMEIPTVSGFHTNFHSYSRHYHLGLLQPLIFRYLRHLHNQTRCTLAPTDALRKYLLEKGFKHVEVTQRGVDTQRFSPAHRSMELRQQWGVGPGQRAVIYVGRLAREKNLALALEAYQSMRSVDPGLRFIVVGDGPMRAQLDQRDEGLILSGAKTGQELATHYASGDIFLFPSETETFGNVTLEAMASGLAVVAYNDAGAADLIRHDHNGLVAERGNAKAFVDIATTLAATPERLELLGKAARKRALSQRWDAVIDHLERVLLDCIDPHSPTDSEKKTLCTVNTRGYEKN